METDPVVINKSLSDFNGDDKAQQLRQYILNDAKQFATNRLMIPWGDDFYYSNAHLTYHSLDNIISYFNQKYDDITLVQSTPSEYIDAIKDLDFTWPVRYDDMMPLADSEDDYWTGYFTSRALSKR